MLISSTSLAMPPWIGEPATLTTVSDFVAWELESVIGVDNRAMIAIVRAAEDDGFSPLEEELLFEDFVRAFMGMDPDRLSDSAYERMFADFKRDVLGGGASRAVGLRA